MKKSKKKNDLEEKYCYGCGKMLKLYCFRKNNIYYELCGVCRGDIRFDSASTQRIQRKHLPHVYRGR